MGRSVKAPHRRDKRARQSALTKQLATLVALRGEGKIKPGNNRWADVLGVADFKDPSGELKKLALRKGFIVDEPSRGFVAVQRMLAVVPAGGGEEDMNAAKKTAVEPARRTRGKNLSKRMPLSKRVRMFWDLLRKHIGVNLGIGFEYDTNDEIIRGFAGYDQEQSVGPFFSNLTRLGVTEWLGKGKQMFLLDLDHISDLALKQLCGTSSAVVGEAKGGKTKEIKAELDSLEKAEAETKRALEEIAVKKKQRTADLAATQRAEKGFAKEAGKVRKHFDKLSEGGKRAFLRDLLEGEETGLLIIELFDELPANATPAKKK